MRFIVRSAAYPLIIIGITVIACIYYWLSLLDTQKAEMAATRHRGELQVQQINEAVDQQMDATLRSVDTALRHLRTIYLHNRKDFDHSVQDVLSAYPKGMLEYAIVIGADGYLAYSSGDKPSDKPRRLFLGDREHFHVHAKGNDDHLFIGKPIIGRLTGIQLVQITRPIRDGNHFVGVIGIPLRPDYISKSLWSLHIDPSDLISILREDGRFIARNRNLSETLNLKMPDDRPFMHSHPGEHGIFRNYSVIDKTQMLFSWRHLDAWPVIAVTAIDENAELRLVNKQQSEARKFALLAMALVISFAIWISTLVARINLKNHELVLSEGSLHESETRFRHIMEFAPIGTVTTALDGHFILVNQAFCTMLGYTKDELEQLKFEDVTYPDDMNLTLGDRQKLIDGEIESYQLEKRYLCKDGRVVWGLITSSLVRTNTGVPSYFIAQVENITDRKIAEEAIRSAARYSRSLIEASLDPLVTIDIEGKITDANVAAERITGIDRSRLVGSDFANYFTNPQKAREGYQHVFIEGFVTDYPLAVRHSSGKITEVLYNASLYSDDNGNLLGVFAAARDITERKKLEEELKERELSYRTVADYTSDWEYWIMPDNSFRYMSPSSKQICGYSPDDFNADPQLLVHIIHSDDLHLYTEHRHRISDQGIPEPIDFRIRTKGGEICWISHVCQPVFDHAGIYIGQRASNRDITKRKKMEHALQESESRFRRILEHAPIGTATSTLDGHLILVNQSLCDMLGYKKEELEKLTFQDISFPECWYALKITQKT